MEYIIFAIMIGVPLGIWLLGMETGDNTRKQHEQLRARGIEPPAANSNRYLGTRDPRGADMGGIE